MRVTASTDLSNLETLTDLRKYATLILTQITNALNGNVDVVDNLGVAHLTFVFTGSGSNVAVSHPLGRVPRGYILEGASAALSVYDGSVANDDKTITLRSNAAGTAKVMVY